MKWLSIVLVSLSCFAFSLSPVPADARQALPTQIEQIIAKKGNSDKTTVSYQKVLSLPHLFSPADRSREHEKNVLINYQREINVHLESISKSFQSFQLFNCSLPLKIISDDSDIGSSSLLLA